YARPRWTFCRQDRTADHGDDDGEERPSFPNGTRRDGAGFARQYLCAGGSWGWRLRRMEERERGKGGTGDRCGGCGRRRAVMEEAGGVSERNSSQQSVIGISEA